MTLHRFRLLETALRANGYGAVIDWSESIRPPEDAQKFASCAIYVICNSGMRVTVAAPIAERCIAALMAGNSSTTVFGHPGKGPAIDDIWARRHELFSRYLAENDKVEMLGALPWIGPVTKHHLAKNLGIDTAKPDVHMERLARQEGATTAKLCQRLGQAHWLSGRNDRLDPVEILRRWAAEQPCLRGAGLDGGVSSDGLRA